ncbi:MAG: hypothetical protein QOF63_1867, partial [Thermoanaerobaculia bacterium]|nr:hypothetical protein [Thermoanaerobaculia bacterium]
LLFEKNTTHPVHLTHSLLRLRLQMWKVE